MFHSTRPTLVLCLYVASFAIVARCDFSMKTAAAASDSDSPSDGQVFFNSGKAKKYKDLSGKLENSVLKSKLQVLGEVFTKRIGYLRSAENKQVELVFLVDASASVGAENFESELKFVRKLLSDFTVSENATRVAVITFASKDQVIRHVDHISRPSSHNHKCGLLHWELPRIKYTGGGTYTLGALLEAQKVLLHARPGAAKAVFLVTDGFSNGGDPTPAAAALKRAGAVVFTFGIDTGNVRELFDVASTPGHEHSYVLDGFAEFAALARRALHQDLKAGVYQPLSDASSCAGLCASGADCCDDGARCACGTDTGHYSCVCPPGHFGSGLVGTCHQCPNGTYSDDSVPGDATTCKPCPDPNHVTLGDATSPDRCVCKAGFRPAGDRCLAVTCPRLAPPPDGYYVRKTCANVLNAACGARCEVGFALTGSSIRLCQEDGTWSGQEVRCILKTCPPLSAPANGTMNCSRADNAVDAECTFACAAGSTLVGSRRRTCLPLGRWDGLPASCKPVTCSALSAPPDGSLSPASCASAKRPLGTRCRVSCADGFTLRGPAERTCDGPRGAWSGGPAFAQCLDLTPPVLKCPANVETTAYRGKSYATVGWNIPTATDNSGKPPTVWTKPATKLPMKFKIGKTKITYVAADSSRNKARCSFNVTVADDQAPAVDGCESPPTFLTNGGGGGGGGGGVELAWDEPVFVDNSGKPVQVERTPGAEHLFAYGTTEVSYIGTDPSGNMAFCLLNVTVQENACHAPPGPAHGAASCTELPSALHCTMTCAEGYAFAIEPRAYFCAYEAETDTLFAPDTGVDPVPDCSVSVLPDVITEQGTVTLRSDTDECNDIGSLDQIASDVATQLAAAIASSCDNDVACYLGNVTAGCDSTLSADEEGSNAVGRRRRAALNPTDALYVVEPKPTGSNIEVHFQMIAERKAASAGTAFDLSKAKSAATAGLAGQEVGGAGKRRKLRVKKLGFRPSPSLGCPRGSVKRGALCVNCPVGTYHANATCQSCPLGTFQSEEGSDGCTPCPPGSSTRRTHARHASECKAICGPGWFGRQRRLAKDAAAVSPCSPCDVGTFQPRGGQAGCVDCPPGTTTAVRGAASPLECLQRCEAGWYSADGLSPCQRCVSPPCPAASDDACLSGPCRNGAACRADAGLFECDCPLGFYGSSCELSVSACASTPCLHGGVCSDVGNASFVCTCPSGYEGTACQTETDECAASPCVNGGLCIDLVDAYLCVNCADGFAGARCEVDIDDCDPAPCANGATCSDHVAGFACSCAAGFVGRRCDQQTPDPCNAEPCANGGLCRDVGHADFTCECPNGYSGLACDVTPCTASPCLNGASCFHHGGILSCVCPTGFGGDRCETEFPAEFVLRFPMAGTTDYVAVRGPSRSLDEVSVCLWLKSEDRFNYGTVFSYATEANDNTFTLTDYNGFVLYVNGERTVTDVSANDGRWRSVCVEWRSAGGSWRILADGAESDAGEGLATGTLIPADGSLVLGQEQDALGGGFSQSESFTGLLSELSVWDRWRTAAEHEQIATACGPRQEGNVFAWSGFLEGIRGRLEVERSSFCTACSPPPLPAHCSVDLSGNGTGATAAYTCSSGYIARGGATTRRCGKQGEWDGSPPLCQRLSCGFPGYFLHGVVAGSSYRYGDRIAYRCLPGYSMLGVATRTCGTDGKWTGAAPKCQGRSCGRPPPPDNGFAARLLDGDEDEPFDDGAVARVGHQVEFRCRDGFLLHGEAVSTCQDSGQWEDLVMECRPIECERLKELDNGTLTLNNVEEFQSGPAVFGAESVAECDVGFQLVGPIARRCLRDGSWSSVAPVCVAVRCDLDRIPFHAADFAAVGDFRLEIFENDFGNGVFEVTGNGFGDVASFRCRPGYRLPVTALGNPSLGNASPTNTTSRSPAANGTVDEDPATGNSGLSAATSGLSAPGGETLRWTCDANGSWRGGGSAESLADAQALCLPIGGNCSTPEVPANAYLPEPAAASSMSVGSTVELRCRLGYVLNGPDRSTCRPDGTWSHAKLTTCQPIECRRLSVPLHTVDMGENVTSGSFGNLVTFRCADGYEAFADLSARCQANGRWSRVRGKCSRVSCGKPAVAGGATIIGMSYLFQDHVVYQCPPGSRMVGVPVLTCTKDGKWEGNATCFPG